MPNSHLVTYLHDHLAGAQAAVQIMDHIEASHGDTRAGSVVRQVRPEILTDRDTLQQIVTAVGGERGATRAAFGWLSEKVVELKLKVDDPSDGALRLLESIELLCVGIDGKTALWNSLRSSTAQIPEIATTDFQGLIARAESQRALVEDVRRDAAIAAFTPRPAS